MAGAGAGDAAAIPAGSFRPGKPAAAAYPRFKGRGAKAPAPRSPAAAAGGPPRFAAGAAAGGSGTAGSCSADEDAAKEDIRWRDQPAGGGTPGRSRARHNDLATAETVAVADAIKKAIRARAQVAAVLAQNHGLLEAATDTRCDAISILH
jgi:hypothetical protein